MGEMNRVNAVRWWAMIVAGTAAALLIAWLGHLTGVPLRTLLSIASGAVALAWLIVLVAVPWNLFFAARYVVAEMAVSRGRGIAISPGMQAEARQIARRMLWFAVGGHVVTAAAAAVVSYLSHTRLGYYAAAAYLLSMVVRPVTAYFSHLRERIGLLTRESKHPRDDVVTLQATVESLTSTSKEFQSRLRELGADLRRTEAKLEDAVSHSRQLLTSDLVRIQHAQATDREVARSRAADLGRRIDSMVRRIEAALDGISDHQELQAGLRALVRMIRTDADGLT